MQQDIVFAEGYQGIEDIADAVIQNASEAQDVPVEELSVIPVPAIDEAEMPRAIKNDRKIPQETWDVCRRRVISEIQSKGYTVD